VFDIHIVDDKLTIRFLDGKKQEETIPQPVREFLDAFNQRQYPDLLLP